MNDLSEKIYELGSFYCFNRSNQKNLEILFHNSNIQVYLIEYFLDHDDIDYDFIRFDTSIGSYLLVRKHFRECKRIRKFENLFIPVI